MIDLSNLIDDLSDESIFSELPVDIDTFMGPGYLEMDEYIKLSPLQKDIVNYSTQIFDLDTLKREYGDAEGRRIHKYTKTQIVCMLGKGNMSYNHRVWSPAHGFVAPEFLMDKDWDANSDQGTNPATPFYDEGEDDVFRITTEKGFWVEVGPNHDLPVIKNTRHHKQYSVSKGEQELPAILVQPKDMLKLHVGWEEPYADAQYDVTEQEARVIGYMLGDGTMVNTRGNSPGLTNATKEVQDDFIDFITSNGGRIREDVSGKGCRRLWVAGMNDWFRKHGLIKDPGQQKSWNYEWMRMSDNNLAALINGLWATDGWISFQTQGRVNLGLRLCSKDVIDGVHVALLRLGIVSSNKPGRSQRGNHNAVYNLDISSVQFAQKFIEVVGPVVGKEVASKKVLEMTTGGGLNNYEWDRVKSVEHIGRMPTVGVRIPITSRYSANGIINFNSGKDLCAEISCAYLVYKLLCIKDPARYFGKPPNDAIDILNVAVNADQAQRVFFKGFTNMIKRSPWFADKIVAPKQRVYEFDKSISVHSGHSEMEAFEGLNTIMVILDEISAFSMLIAQSAATDVSPAEATYLMYKASLTSRFPDIGKLVMLSWPRHKGDFISTKYDKFTKVKDVVEKSVEVAINPEMPIDTPGNKLTVEWTEDIIHDYMDPGVWALRKPSWVVNPKMKIRDYISDFLSNYRDSRNRFAATPTDGSDGFFSDHDAISRNLTLRNGVNPENGIFEPWFKPRDDREYFIHVDLARKHDRAVVAIAHVDKWRYQEIFPGQFEDTPYVVVDAYRYWTPTREQQISFIDVKNFILDVARAGFNIEVITFDQWESTDMINYFNGVGMRAEKMSVGLEQYNDLKLMLVEDRVKVPHDDILKTELEQLKMTKNMKNVDHPSDGCFVGETRVPLLDGTRPMISELDGEEVWVYSATPDGKIVPGKARGRMTKKTNRLVDVVLDSGAVIRCTPEHPFMLRNGEYKAAEELRPGIDRLMPINQVWPGGNNHKVRAVIHVELDESVAVYDLEVDKWSNFALSAGVFVHNSKDIADAVAGAVHNAFARSYSDSNEESEVLTLTDVHARMAAQRDEATRASRTANHSGLIMPPKRADHQRRNDNDNGEWGVRVL